MTRKSIKENPSQLTFISGRSLDDWYKRVNKIYLDRNYYRTPESIFAHLVEIVGGLSLLASGKQKEGVNPDSYMAKAIAWWMALCGKLRIRSVESLLWAKFPYACPYCHQRRHHNPTCKPLKLKHKGPDWEKVAKLRKENSESRPGTFGKWLTMFAEIYTPEQEEKFPSVFARVTEELGELAEATRLFDLAPGYFFSEAADFFAWIMHLQAVRFDHQGVYGEAAENELSAMMFDEYPDVCKDCENQLCICPPVLRSTFGRIAREMPLGNLDQDGGAPLLSFSEAVETFNLSSSRVSIGGETFAVTLEMIRGVRGTIGELKAMAIESKGMDQAHAVTLIKTFDEVLKLAESERVTQAAIDEMIEAIRNLPSERRSMIASFIASLAANATSPLIIKLAAYVGTFAAAA